MINISEQGEGGSERMESVAEQLRQSPFWGKSVTKAPSFDGFVAEQKSHMSSEKAEAWDEAAQGQTYGFFLEQLNEEKKKREQLYSSYVQITLTSMGQKTYMPFEEFEAKNYGIEESK